MAAGSNNEIERALEVRGLEGEELVQALYANEEFMEEAAEGFRQIREGNNTVITFDDVRESLRSGKPLF